MTRFKSNDFGSECTEVWRVKPLSRYGCLSLKITLFAAIVTSDKLVEISNALKYSRIYCQMSEHKSSTLVRATAGEIGSIHDFSYKKL